MSRCSISHRPEHAQGYPRSRGFTLIELMIAMVLGLIVVAGVSSIFLANQQTYRSNEALSEVQDGARTSFEMLARDVRAAGLAGCNTTSGRGVFAAAGYAANWYTDWGTTKVLLGYDNATTDPAITGLTGNGAPVAGTSSVHILSTDAISAVVDTDSGSLITTNEASGDLQNGDVIMVCDDEQSTLLTISALSGKSVTVEAHAHTFARSSPIAKLTAHVWYIGTNPLGGKSLYRLAMTNTGGVIGATPQEIVRNATDLQIRYLQPAVGNSFIAVSSVTDWAAVLSAQMTLTLQSTFQRAGTDSKPLTRQFTSTATVRNRVL